MTFVNCFCSGTVGAGTVGTVRVTPDDARGCQADTIR